MIFKLLDLQAAGYLDDDVVGFHAGVVFVAAEALEAGGAGGEHFHFALLGRGLAGEVGETLVDLFFLAEAHLGGDVRAADSEGAGFAAAEIDEDHDSRPITAVPG